MLKKIEFYLMLVVVLATPTLVATLYNASIDITTWSQDCRFFTGLTTASIIGGLVMWSYVEGYFID